MTTKATNPSFGATKPEANVANPSFGATKPEANVANPSFGATKPEANVANPNATKPETNIANPSFGATSVKATNPSFGATPKAGVNYSNVETPEARAHGGTPEGNTNNPYGTKPQAKTANPSFGATTPQAKTANPYGTTTPLEKVTRFGVGQVGGAAKQPLSMVSYKMFLRTGMYYSGTTLQGNPLTKANHDAALAGFTNEVAALKDQVIANEQNQALTLEFEPLRNNYWLNNNGYDQVYI